MPTSDFYAAQHTITQLKTIPRELRLGSATNIAVSSTTEIQKNATSTVPASGSGSIVIDTEGMSYMKIIPLIEDGGGKSVASPTLRVLGWNYYKADNLYVPQFITEVAITLGAQALTVNGASNMKQPYTMSKSYGDAKINGSNPSHRVGAFLLVDTVGCRHIELHFRGTLTSTPVCNILYASL